MSDTITLTLQEFVDKVVPSLLKGIYENDIKELKGKADFVSSVMNAQEERLQALEAPDEEWEEEWERVKQGIQRELDSVNARVTNHANDLARVISQTHNQQKRINELQATHLRHSAIEAAREVKASKSPPNGEEADETANHAQSVQTPGEPTEIRGDVSLLQRIREKLEEREETLMGTTTDNERRRLMSDVMSVAYGAIEYLQLTATKRREALRQRDEAMNERDTLVIKCKLLESRISAAHKATEDARAGAKHLCRRFGIYREALEAYADEENWEQEQESAYKDHWAPTEHGDTHVLFRVDGADLHGFTLAQHALKEGGEG